MSYKPLTVKEVLNRAIAWKTPTAVIPENRLFDCWNYIAQNPERNRERELNAYDLVAGWKALQDGGRVAGRALAGQKLLAENATAACERCFGKGKEIVTAAGGSTSAKDCDHSPLTDEERRANADAKAAFFRKVRELARRPAQGRAPASPRRPKPPTKGTLFVCSVCKRIVSSEVGWTEFEPCNFKLGMKTNGRDPVLCDGMMNLYRAEETKGTNDDGKKE